MTTNPKALADSVDKAIGTIGAMTHEIWKPVVGWEALYEVSSLGRVRRSTASPARNGVRPGRILTPYRNRANRRNYVRLVVNLSNGDFVRTTKVHRMVAEAFLPADEIRPFVNHKNGNPLDNRVENLEWCTNDENIAHAKKSGMIARGENHYLAKLRSADIAAIRTRFSNGERQLSLAREFCVSRSNISAIVVGRSHKDTQ